MVANPGSSASRPWARSKRSFRRQTSSTSIAPAHPPGPRSGLRSSGNGNRVLIRVAGRVESEASQGTSPELKRRLRLE